MPPAQAAVITAPSRTRPRTKPASKPKARARHKSRSRGAIIWIAVSAVLLAGVVFVNLAVLQLNLKVDKATQERTQLRATTAQLQSQLSAALASPRIQAQARRVDGLVPADPSTFGHINLAP
jgi:uncharacterized protein HemX